MADIREAFDFQKKAEANPHESASRLIEYLTPKDSRKAKEPKLNSKHGMSDSPTSYTLHHFVNSEVKDTDAMVFYGVTESGTPESNKNMSIIKARNYSSGRYKISCSALFKGLLEDPCFVKFSKRAYYNAYNAPCSILIHCENFV